LLDEPFANLDALTRLQMQKWLISLRAKLNQTILMVTHDIDEAIRLADTIYVMDSLPGPFTEVVTVPEILHTEDGENSPMWMELKHCLMQKLVK
jgi:ABC-type nitrate/sulfonate/bicarbonate transport system ATPase subunit